METIYIEGQILLLEKKLEKKYHHFVVCLISLESSKG